MESDGYVRTSNCNMAWFKEQNANYFVGKFEGDRKKICRHISDKCRSAGIMILWYFSIPIWTGIQSFKIVKKVKIASRRSYYGGCPTRGGITGMLVGQLFCGCDRNSVRFNSYRKGQW